MTAAEPGLIGGSLVAGGAGETHPALGQARQPSCRAAGSAHPIGLFFGAICPKEGKGAGLVLPRCTTSAMQLHLAEIAQAVTPGAQAVVLLDQAGWHMTDKPAVPANITLLPIPARSPELNAAENVWQFLRDNWLPNRIFKSHTDILDHGSFAWNSLMAQPWKIMSIGLRQRAHRS